MRNFGESDRVEKLLDGLVEAGIVRKIDEGGNTVVLSYLALTRRWEWLAAEIKQRMNREFEAWPSELVND